MPAFLAQKGKRETGTIPPVLPSPTLHKTGRSTPQKRSYSLERGMSEGRQSRSPSMHTPQPAAVVPSSQTSLGLSSGTEGFYSLATGAKVHHLQQGTFTTTQHGTGTRRQFRPGILPFPDGKAAAALQPCSCWADLPPFPLIPPAPKRSRRIRHC